MNYKNIININKKKQLNKFKLNKPIYQNNYLFHYLIIFNNLKGLKLYKFPIYIENNDNLNGFCLAAKEDNIEILYYLIENYPDYIYNRNINNEKFTDYLSIDRFNELIIKYNYLDWNRLIDRKLLYIILINLKYNELIKFINNYKIIKPVFWIFKNININNKKKIKLLDKFSDDELNVKDEDNIGLIFYAFDNIDLYNYLINRNIDLNYYTLIKTLNPIRIAIKLDILNNNTNYTDKINITREMCNELDKNCNNMLHTLLNIRISRNNQLNNLTKINYSLDYNILKLCDSDTWNQYNTEYISPIELVTYLDFNIYSNTFIENNISINNIILKKINNNIWLNFLKKLPSYNKDILNINLYIDCTKFQSKFSDICIFMLYLSEKYKELYVPKLKSYLINNLTYIDNFPFSDDLINKEPIFPWFITFVSENEYYIHPYLNNLINKNTSDKLYTIIFLSLKYENLLHANLLIYNHKRKIIERFEPYGKCYNINIDNILEEELTWNTNYKYIKPNNYLPYSGFQTISDENNITNLKPGDFGGFCLAWCIWYIETKLLNPTLNSSLLVRKLINKLNNQNIKYNEYIRIYADKINNNRISYLNKIGINNKYVNNIYYSDNINKIIINYIIDKYSQ
jgi:hypothetical protein